MKKIRSINDLLRYFGWKKESIKQLPNAAADKEDTKALLQNFLSNALKAINDELENQLRMSGFAPEKLRAGLFILTCEITTDKLHPSVKHQTYRVGNIEIMRVEWKLNGFSIHVRERQAAKQIKKDINKGLNALNINVGAGLIIDPTLSKEDIELTARAVKMVDEFDKTPAPDLKNGPGLYVNKQ